MPFIQRVIEPKYLSRTKLFYSDGRPKVKDDELQAVTNNTLCNAVKQLASLTLHANDMFNELTEQLTEVAKRSRNLSLRFVAVADIVENYDPKSVTVRRSLYNRLLDMTSAESSLSDFASIKVHYKAKHSFLKELFTPDTRPPCVQALYDNASNRPLQTTELDVLRRDIQNTPFVTCTPVFGTKRRRPRNVDIDIETRKPAVVEDLRKWTSKEALGEVSAATDASIRVSACVTLTPDQLSEVDSGDEAQLDHLLPSPEEQLQVIVTKFAPEMVQIDTSGRFFDRMCQSRKSLLHIETNGETDTVKRRTRSRKSRGKRRNTITGTDQREIREAIAGESPNATTNEDIIAADSTIRSKSGDLLAVPHFDLTTIVKKSGHFDSLKRWGKTRLKSIGRNNNTEKQIKNDNENENVKDTATETKEMVTAVPHEIFIGKRRRFGSRTHERTPSYSSSEAGMIPVPVRLRDRRLRRARTEEEPHSSSGNWSASSESGRASLTSEARTRHQDASSEGTATPDVGHEELETGSEYSCDTEGYYTSFHVDSGLKTLREEEPSKVRPETDYELFGRGSTSTTASSAGTVCTIRAASERDLSAPLPPERASSLNNRRARTTIESRSPSKYDNTRVYSAVRTNEIYNKKLSDGLTPSNNMIDEHNVVSSTVEVIFRGSSSPDSGHNTSSSPIDDSISSAHGKQSPSERDYSSCSDLEGADRTERIRTKVAINSSRIPSMCVITPAASDDEGSVRNSAQAVPIVPLVPLVNIVDRIRSVLPQRLTRRQSPPRPPMPLPDTDMFDPGEYVTIADVENNNKKHTNNIYDVGKKLRSVLSGDPETEYVSLNELPDVSEGALGGDKLSRIGTKVNIDSTGKIIYSSDSIRRRKAARTTFEPGPCVNIKTECISNKVSLLDHEILSNKNRESHYIDKIQNVEKSTSNTYGPYQSTQYKNIARVTPTPVYNEDAYVDVHEAEGVNLSPVKDDVNKGYQHLVRGDTQPTDSMSTILNSQQHCYESRSFAATPRKEMAGFSSNLPRRHHGNFYSDTLLTPIQKIATMTSAESFKVSPIDPCFTKNFLSSTPTYKGSHTDRVIPTSPRSTMTNEELYSVIHKSKKKLNLKDNVGRASSPALSNTTLSPVSSESSLVYRASPRQIETGYLVDVKTRMSGLPDIQTNIVKQSAIVPSQKVSTCADRLGPIQQTSRLDFKKLLLQHGVKLGTTPNQSTHKVSAVERLKVSKENIKSNSPKRSHQTQLNILDLSGSPKIYNQRKLIRNMPNSPVRTAYTKPHPKILSPKSQWRFSSPRSDVLSSPILEANNEDETSPSSSVEKSDSVKEATCHFGARRTLLPIKETTTGDSKEIEDFIVEPKNNQIENASNLAGSSRANLQIKRAEFFSSKTDEIKSHNSSLYLNPVYKAPIQEPITKDFKRNSPSPPTLETAL